MECQVVEEEREDRGEFVESGLEQQVLSLSRKALAGGRMDRQVRVQVLTNVQRYRYL